MGEWVSCLSLSRLSPDARAPPGPSFINIYTYVYIYIHILWEIDLRFSLFETGVGRVGRRHARRERDPPRDQRAQEREEVPPPGPDTRNTNPKTRARNPESSPPTPGATPLRRVCQVNDPRFRPIFVADDRKVEIRLHGKGNSRLPWRKARHPSEVDSDQ